MPLVKNNRNPAKENRNATKRAYNLTRSFVCVVGALLLSLMLTLCCVPIAAFAAVQNNIIAPLADSQEGGNADGTGETDTPTKNHVTELFLKWSSDYDGPNAFVGPGEEIEKVEIYKYGQLVQLNAYYLDASGSGILLETASSSTDLGAIDLIWSSNNVDVVTVSPTGLVTPKGNGTATITAEIADPDKYGQASYSVDVIVDGQEGEYVGKVEITDDEGNIIPDGETIVLESDSDEPIYYQLQAIVTWVDPQGNVLREEYTNSAEGVSTSLIWETAGNTSILYVNETTGRVATQESGIAAVILSAAGGVAGSLVSDTVYFNVLTEQRRSGTAAEDLTINVYYENFPDELVTTETFSLEYLEATLPQETHNYTVMSGSRFGTIRARGYLFKDILGLVNVNLDDILLFRFGTSDNYQNSISYDYLFGYTRYYFPDYDIGYTLGAVSVPPLFATACNLHWNASYIDPTEALDEGWRFRLVFGVSSTTDTNTSMQVYYIHTINIILKGGPPESTGSGSGSDGNNDNPGTDPGDVGGVVGSGTDTGGTGTTGNGTGTGAGSGTGNGTGTGAGSGSGTGTGTGTGDAGSGMGAGTGDAGATSSGNGSNVGGVYSGMSSEGDSTGQNGESGVSAGGEGSTQGDASGNIDTEPLFAEDISGLEGETVGPNDGADSTNAAAWNIYQMMINSESNPGDLDYDNPYDAFTIPIACAAAVGGGISMFFGYRRRLFA